MIIEQMEHKNIVYNNIEYDINPEIIQGSIQAAAVIPRGDVVLHLRWDRSHLVQCWAW